MGRGHSTAATEASETASGRLIGAFDMFPSGGNEPQVANGHLATAAPELLVALTNLLAFVEGECGSIAEDDCNVLAAHAALAKAES